MRLLKTSLFVSAQNIRKWATNYRVYVLALMVAVFLYDITAPIVSFAEQSSTPVVPWVFPFLFSIFTETLLYMGLIFLFCDAPFIDDSTPYIIIRSGRRSWNAGQLIYLTIATGLYLIFIFVISMIYLAPQLDFNSQWGKVFTTLAHSKEASFGAGLEMPIDKHIIDFFTPMQAIWFTFLLKWLSGVFLAMVVYVINMMTRSQSLGIAAGMFVVLLNPIAMKFPTPVLVWFSPMSWSSLSMIDISGATGFPGIQYVISCYLILITLLTVVSIIKSKNEPINVILPV